MGRIHQNIIQLRKAQGHTQKSMSERLGISESTYNRLENGEIDLAYERHLVPIARVLDMEVEDLFLFRYEKYIAVRDMDRMRRAYQILKEYFDKTP